MGWKPEVLVSGEWGQNALVFATEEEAKESAGALFGRWTLCQDHRAVEVDEEANYRRIAGMDSPLRLQDIEEAKEDA